MDNRWWDTASGRDIERGTRLPPRKDDDPAARSGRGDPGPGATSYGLDVDNLGAEDASVAAALSKAERDREQNATEESQGPEALAEEAGMKYDSAERRQELAARLDGVADREAARARLSADQDETPPSAAVAKAPGKSPKARKTRSVSGPTKFLRTGMGR